MPRPFSPKSRAEAIAAPLEDVRKAAAEDPRFLHGLAVIVADLIRPAEVTAPAPDPEAPQPSARTRRAWSGVMERINAR